MGVLYSDETTIEILPGARRRKCYRTANQKYEPRFIAPTTKHPAKIMVWGCFGNGRVGPLHPVEGAIDSHAYIAIMRSCLDPAKQAVFDGGDFVFQQDNAPCHVSKTTKRWFARHNIDTMEWPPQSPDLNPIEHLWTDLKRRVYAKIPFANTTELQRAAEESWAEIPKGTLLNLIRSMPERVREVIDNHGGPTHF